MVFFLAIYIENIRHEDGTLHKDPWITERIVTYGFSEDQVYYSVPKRCLRNISPGDHLVLTRFEGEKLKAKSLNEVLCVFTRTPVSDKQTMIPEFHNKEEATKWAYDQIEKLPVGLEEREEFKKAFAPDEPTFIKHHLLHPQGPVVLTKKLIELDAEITPDDIREMMRTKKEIFEVNLRFLQGFARHVRPIPERIVFRWILDTARKHRLIFFSK